MGNPSRYREAPHFAQLPIASKIASFTILAQSLALPFTQMKCRIPRSCFWLAISKKPVLDWWSVASRQLLNFSHRPARAEKGEVPDGEMANERSKNGKCGLSSSEAGCFKWHRLRNGVSFT
jgi:hypothetical protein